MSCDLKNSKKIFSQSRILPGNYIVLRINNKVSQQQTFREIRWSIFLIRQFYSIQWFDSRNRPSVKRSLDVGSFYYRREKIRTGSGLLDFTSGKWISRPGRPARHDASLIACGAKRILQPHAVTSTVIAYLEAKRGNMCTR